jgi:hypothetical protein
MKHPPSRWRPGPSDDEFDNPLEFDRADGDGQENQQRTPTAGLTAQDSPGSQHYDQKTDVAADIGNDPHRGG